MRILFFKDGLHLRTSTDLNSEAENLIRLESISRESAYRNTRIRTNSSFYDDSDMKSEYYLVLVYDTEKNIPLLTARYYFDIDAIRKCLKGDNQSSHIINSLEKFFSGSLFLADRFSANLSSAKYRMFRTYIYALFYREIFRNTENGSFIIMARKEKGDKLLNKYLAIGTEIKGTVMHKGKEHWVLFGDVNKSYKIVKSLYEKQNIFV
ncbi:MAG: hypothetical protein JNL60_06240 [Bacteroidia bacterium]|nr:hypothetical protein [Bacteroidia bacterium]